MNKESTLYDYTKSAEELRAFELGETCSRIIHEYEMFNIQNDVYKMFGEWLLEQAKTGYRATFTEKILLGFLKSKRLSNPKSELISASKDDYDQCEKLRELCSSNYTKDPGGFNSDYCLYTLWKIAKTYNCRNGCIVVDAPSRLMANSNWVIALDWSKDAQDCISHEAWKPRAQDTFSVGFCFAASLVICLVMDLIALIILAFFIPDEQLLIPGFWLFIGGFVNAAFLYFHIKKIMISSSMELYAKGFEAHCKRIEETRYSRYNIRLDEQRDWAGNCLGWF